MSDIVPVDIDTTARYEIRLDRTILFIDGKPRTPAMTHVMTGALVRWIDDRNPGAIVFLNPVEETEA